MEGRSLTVGTGGGVGDGGGRILVLCEEEWRAVGWCVHGALADFGGVQVLGNQGAVFLLENDRHGIFLSVLQI